MVEAAGIEPYPASETAKSYHGQEEIKSGQNEDKIEQCQGLANMPRSIEWTDPTQPDTSSGTQKDPNLDITGDALPADLRELIDAWPRLPDAVRAGIMAMVRVSRKKGRPG